MRFEAAKPADFPEIRNFYWNLIDRMKDQNDLIGWKKGIYPTDEFLRESLEKGELFTLRENNLLACVILNSDHNEGYESVKWLAKRGPSEVLTPHALAVSPDSQGKGIGKLVVREIFDFARESGKKSVRLDILGVNKAAEKLYTSMGFLFVGAKDMFYEDTGLAEYKMYEYIL